MAVHWPAFPGHESHQQCFVMPEAYARHIKRQTHQEQAPQLTWSTTPACLAARQIGQTAQTAAFAMIQRLISEIDLSLGLLVKGSLRRSVSKCQGGCCR